MKRRVKVIVGGSASDRLRVHHVQKLISRADKEFLEEGARFFRKPAHLLCSLY